MSGGAVIIIIDPKKQQQEVEYSDITAEVMLSPYDEVHQLIEQAEAEGLAVRVVET